MQELCLYKNRNADRDADLAAPGEDISGKLQIASIIVTVVTAVNVYAVLTRKLFDEPLVTLEMLKQPLEVKFQLFISSY